MDYHIEENPLISVVLPVRNAGEFLPECLQSLLFQNYQNIEIIAIDDASIDNSMQVLNAFKDLDKRLRIYKNIKNYGLAVTLNRCLKRARGKFVAFMDPKDTITPNKLQKQLDFLTKNEKFVAVGTQCLYVNYENKRIGKSNFPEIHENISTVPIHGVSVLFEGIMINRYRIPRDFLHFPINKRFFLYSDMGIRLLQYGKLANMPEFLQTHRKQTSIIQSKTRQIASLAKLWLSARFNYQTRLPLASLFSGVLSRQ